MAEVQIRPQRQSYLSLIRVISCIGVVILHTYYVYVSYFEATIAQRALSYGIRNAMMWAVPCFVMVTGALLLDPARSLSFRKLFTRYISRMLITILVFTLVFYAFDLWLTGTWPSLKDIPAALLAMVTDGSWSHMWYLYMLLGLYLLMPAFRLITAGADRHTLRYLILIGLAFMVLLPTLETVLGFKSGFYLPVYTVYPFYLFLGYVLHKQIIRIPRWLGAPMFVAGILATVILTRLQIARQITAIGKLTGNYSFIIIALMAAGLFSLLKPREGAAHQQEHPNSSRLTASNSSADDGSALGFGTRFLLFLDAHSFGIYLLHFLILKFAVTQIRWNPYRFGGNLMLVPVTVAVFLLSLGLCWILKKIPGIRKIL